MFVIQIPTVSSSSDILTLQVGWSNNQKLNCSGDPITRTSPIFNQNVKTVIILFFKLSDQSRDRKHPKYSHDLKTGHLNTGNIRKADI